MRAMATRFEVAVAVAVAGMLSGVWTGIAPMGAGAWGSTADA